MSSASKSRHGVGRRSKAAVPRPRGSLDLNFKFPQPAPVAADNSYHNYHHYYNYDYYSSQAEDARRSQILAAETSCRSPLRRATELDPEPHDSEKGPEGGIKSPVKEKTEGTLLQAQIKSADMTEDMQQEAIDVAQEGMNKFNIEKDIAQYIKKTFDERKGPTWHCIVGRNFGSFVTHETKHFIYFYLGHCAILLFKTQ